MPIPIEKDLQRSLAEILAVLFQFVWMLLIHVLADGDVIVTFSRALSADIVSAGPDDVLACELKAYALTASQSFVMSGRFSHTEMLQMVHVSGAKVTLDPSPPRMSMKVSEHFFAACESGVSICTIFESGTVALGGVGQLADVDAISILDVAALRDRSSIGND